MPFRSLVPSVLRSSRLSAFRSSTPFPRRRTTYYFRTKNVLLATPDTFRHSFQVDLMRYEKWLIACVATLTTQHGAEPSESEPDERWMRTEKKGTKFDKSQFVHLRANGEQLFIVDSISSRLLLRFVHESLLSRNRIGVSRTYRAIHFCHSLNHFPFRRWCIHSLAARLRHHSRHRPRADFSIKFKCEIKLYADSLKHTDRPPPPPLRIELNLPVSCSTYKIVLLEI